MGYQAYIIDRFDTTHENVFFRALDSKFKDEFGDLDGNHVLIGNVSVGGHALDAIFIKRGAIFVIDFKDYEGKLSFKENGPWNIKTENNKLIFVAGGASTRNPFHQVKAYRFSLFPLLSENEGEILEPNHKVAWDHTKALVLFHRPVSFDQNEIPNKIQRYFHISDFDNIVDKINDCHSKKLELSDTEISNILKVLNFGEDDKYNNQAEDKVVTENAFKNPARMERIKQLIPKIESDTEEEKAIAFYSTMIAIERINESTVSDIYQYPINWEDWNGKEQEINIESNSAFHAIYRDNLNQQFPKDLFIGVNIQLDTQIVPLLHTVVVSTEIEDLKKVAINFNGFTLFRHVLSKLQLSEDAIEELSTIISEADDLNKMINEIRNYLQLNVELTTTISIGLNSKSNFTAQLQSELSSFKKNKTPLIGKLFKSFLTGQKLQPNTLENKHPIIQITPLNTSQKIAIKESFQQDLTVITGPPGTGKSQVVINMLANAAVLGKKVLFASKNNEAVDNVYRRINELLETKYFLRLGSSDRMDEFQTTIHLFLQQKQKNELKDGSEKLKALKAEYNETKKTLLNLSLRINSIPSLTEKVDNANIQYEANLNKEIGWLNTCDKTDKILYKIESINIYNSEINKVLTKVRKANKKGKSQLVFNLFQKSNCKKTTFQFNNKLPPQLREIVEQTTPYIDANKSLTQSLNDNLTYIQALVLRQKSLKETLNELKTKIAESKQAKTELIAELNEIESNKEQYTTQISELTERFLPLGIEITKLAISESLRKGSSESMANYSNYLNNQLPWKNDEQKEFAAVTQEFLSIFNAISITNLTVKKAFLLHPGQFDLVVIDEATQCDSASALPLLFRAKNAVIIGDPLQLPHITSVAKHEQDYVLDSLGLARNNYDYVSKSLFDQAFLISNKTGLKSPFLKEHYRCHPDIINFSNHYFYKRKAGQELTINTIKESFKFGEPGMHWVDVVGVAEKKNVNEAEAEKCIELVQKLVAQHPSATIGIVTPFKDQKKNILGMMKNLPNNHKVVCDTVHKFQGDEKDIMVFSLVVTNESKPSLERFINKYSPYILNVGITRARSALYIVGNKSYCKSLMSERDRSLLCNLAHYAESLKSQ